MQALGQDGAPPKTTLPTAVTAVAGGHGRDQAFLQGYGVSNFAAVHRTASPRATGLDRSEEGQALNTAGAVFSLAVTVRLFGQVPHFRPRQPTDMTSRTC